ncbi:DUF3800 domain-containing protein [Priestia aryabhattai]|uniref:DUF3800 domain-containing protein n=1 Tax=Priestia aryabhattai TaxID=412384 RepID=UPI002E1E0A2E|nr:DUF3800 domain-containing protein [Priestia aryabhattai]MED4261359.1 DUF3800 domain-containing protein [Priestia aryabhattai]
MKYIYCDESCHLENDKSEVMVLGGISCPDSAKQQVFKDIRDLKIKHGLSSWFEIKWTKVSMGKIKFYTDLIDYFFANKNLSFRGVVVTDKSSLDHDLYNNGDYNEWYYKMYYQLLDTMTVPVTDYKIFIDIKDTQGGPKVKKLQKVLCNNKYDFNQEIIKDIKQIHSNESEILQLCDLFIGALSFYHRGLYYKDDSSEAKKSLVKVLQGLYSINLVKTTPKYEAKFNLFVWQPSKRKGAY